MKARNKLAGIAAALAIGFGLSGCSGIDSITDGKRIIRISHAQSEEHPEHQGLLKFKEVIESKLGDKQNWEINMRFRFSPMSFWVQPRKQLSFVRPVQSTLLWQVPPM